MRNQAVAFVVTAAASTSSSSSSSRLLLLLLAARCQAEGSRSSSGAALAVFAARRFSCSSSSSSSSSSSDDENRRRWPPRGAAAAATGDDDAWASSPSASPPPPPPSLPLRSPTVAVWGADTGVGKTLVSAGLAAAAVGGRGRGQQGGRPGVLFVKPVQTGFPADDDAAVVAGAAAAAEVEARAASGASVYSTSSASFQLVHGRHASEAAAAAAGAGSSSSHSSSSPASLRRAVTQHAWRLPASPHAAVALEGRGVSDAELARELAREIGEWDGQFLRRRKEEGAGGGGGSASAAAVAPPLSSPPPPPHLLPPPLFDSLVLAETAGGPLSPSPSGSLQADAWRALRLPPLLVASPRLGGVSATLAAAEALVARGHGAPVAAVVLAGGEKTCGEKEGERVPAGHVEALERHLGALGVPLVVLPRACAPPPPPPASLSSSSSSPPAFSSS